MESSDGDMYGSTMVALENQYPKLSSGRFCIIDDWHVRCTRSAVEDCRECEGITEPVESIDRHGAHWRKKEPLSRQEGR